MPKQKCARRSAHLRTRSNGRGIILIRFTLGQTARKNRGAILNIDDPMKAKLMLLLVALAATVACHRDAEKAAAADEKNKKEKPRVQQGTNGETVINLDAETQKKMGLQTAQLETMQLGAETRALCPDLDPCVLV